MPIPVKDTYDTVVVPLLSLDDQRDSSGTIDDMMLNFLPEISKEADGSSKITLVKRDGSEEKIATTGSGVVRGIYSWDSISKFYVVIDRDIYVYDTTDYSLITTLTNAFATGTGQVGFTEYIYSTGIVTLICTDGTTLNEITDAEVITASGTVAGTVGTHKATPIYYNGYLLLVKSNTGDCYNSTLDLPLTWVAGNFISAEISPDDVTEIAKVNNYFVLFGRSSVEYFYDVGNPTGTPFARNDTFVKNIGYKYNSYRAIATYGNSLFFLGYKTNSGLDIFHISDFSVESITTPAIRRWLDSLTGVVYINVVSMHGHDLLVAYGGSRCFYYDLKYHIWGRLAFKDNTLQFVMKLATTVLRNSIKTTLFVTTDDNTVYGFSPSLYQDDGVDFACIVRTRPLNFNTSQQKYMSNISLWADRYNVGNILVEASDDDYQTYPISRTIDLSVEHPRATQWGRFRSRAFRFTYTTNNPLRIRNMEIDLNIGTQ